MKMTFPIINISEEKWDEDYLSDYICFDKYIYTNKDSLFNEYYKNKLFCDCNGFIYIAIRKKELTEKWRNWFKFIPNIWKTEVIFELTSKKMSVEELKEYFIDRISELKETEFKKEWIINIKNSKTYAELINGEYKQ